MKRLIMKNGYEITIDDDTPPYYIKDNILYVYTPTMYGCSYLPYGEVEREEEV